MGAIDDVIRSVWGYESLLPLQREAIEAALAGRDALVILPTGGGKSLCYQVPAVMTPGVTVVISPLIALMKDQVDRLESRGIGTGAIHGAVDRRARDRVEAGVRAGRVRLLYVAPERFSDGAFRRLIAAADVRGFVIDEAHCISHWGHDFRAAYGRLAHLRRDFPRTPLRAYTATATLRVQEDVVRLLALRDPAILVGDVFRPNLRLRVVRRSETFRDVRDAVAARPGEAGLVYAIRRADVDDLARRLLEAGVRAVAYHAGMEEGDRSRAQDAWMSGRAEVVVATVAFGMGIDRRDVRYVIHAAMPQSPEHYQQEAGRAGRDGLEADCLLFWSPDDADLWKSLIRAQGTSEGPAKERLVGEMLAFCASGACRHRRLVEYFGQEWKGGSCGGCDRCEGAGQLAAAPASRPFERALYERLRRVRLEVADARGVPASSIATESALGDLARGRPATLDQIRRVPGVGKRGIREWGATLIRAIREFGE